MVAALLMLVIVWVYLSVVYFVGYVFDIKDDM
jgi:hypothetical protein